MKQRVVTHIKTNNLSKTFDGAPVVNAVNITIRSGRTLIIAGPNGGGKTTLIDCLCGLLSPDDPTMIARPDCPSSATSIDIRRSIGYVPDEDDTIEFLTATEYIQLVAAAYNQPTEQTITTALDILQKFDFDLRKTRQLINSFSHGMKKKLQLAAILAVSPPIIAIDEPTNGLDPTAVILLKKILRDTSFATTAFVIATHNLAFAQSLGGELLLLQQSPLAYGATTTLISDHQVTSIEELYEKLITIPV